MHDMEPHSVAAKSVPAGHWLFLAEILYTYTTSFTKSHYIYSLYIYSIYIFFCGAKPSYQL
jgi:hypothetical protein